MRLGAARILCWTAVSGLFAGTTALRDVAEQLPIHFQTAKNTCCTHALPLQLVPVPRVWLRLQALPRLRRAQGALRVALHAALQVRGAAEQQLGWANREHTHACMPATFLALDIYSR